MLTNERMGEVALLVLQLQIEEEGVKIGGKEFLDGIRRKAEALGISPDEAGQFLQQLVQDSLTRMLAKQKKP